MTLTTETAEALAVAAQHCEWLRSQGIGRRRAMKAIGIEGRWPPHWPTIAGHYAARWRSIQMQGAAE